MKATAAEIETYLKSLEEIPLRVRALSKGIDDGRLRFKPDRESWSANDILAHLRSCVDVWGDSIYRMLSEENPMVPYRHPRQWIRKTDYLELSFHESFQAFFAQRKKLLKALKSISFEDWSRAAIIKGREHTVFTQARRLALHENAHCQQIEELLK